MKQSITVAAAAALIAFAVPASAQTSGGSSAQNGSTAAGASVQAGGAANTNAPMAQDSMSGNAMADSSMSMKHKKARMKADTSMSGNAMATPNTNANGGAKADAMTAK